MADRMQCRVDGCERLTVARQLCPTHYQRWRKHGDPLAGRTPEGEPMRFVIEVALHHKTDECLTWPYSRNPHGRGQIWHQGRLVLAHRLVCEMIHGEAPEGTEAAHGCGNGHRGCVNPKHLRWATHRENMADRAAHGTHVRGERSGRSKLTEAQVRSIRAMRGRATIREIARQIGTSHATVSDIHTGRSWAWLTE